MSYQPFFSDPDDPVQDDHDYQEIKLPYGFKARSYQTKTFKARFFEKKHYLIDVIHRRGGKTKTAINLLLMGAMTRIGLYTHCFPTLKQAREIIWQGIDEEGKRYLDHIPQELIKGKPHSTYMRVPLINGSVIKLAGSDNYNRIVGGNPMGIIFDEYPLGNPLAWDYLSPVIRKNKGWVYFPYTPRGRNHGYRLFKMAQTNPEWFVQKLNITQTFNLDGLSVFSEADVEAERKQGRPEEIIQQEYYCSFEGVQQGAYYGDVLKKAREERRICKLEILENVPVYTFWDLGVGDSQSIWFMQPQGGSLRFIYYYENQGKGIQFYIDFMRQLQKELKIRYADSFAPFDIEHREWSSGRTRLEIARANGLSFKVVNKISIDEGISCVRAIFERCYFDEKRCEHGLRCLEAYHREWDEKHQCYNEKPVHNWASDGSDSFRYFAVAWRDWFNTDTDESRITKVRGLNNFY